MIDIEVLGMFPVFQVKYAHSGRVAGNERAGSIFTGREAAEPQPTSVVGPKRA